jgi:hypothetical protein
MRRHPPARCETAGSPARGVSGYSRSTTSTTRSAA